MQPVRNFSPADIHTTKKQIFNYVSDIEDKYIWMRDRPNNDRGCADQPASNSTSRHTFNKIEQLQRYQQDSVHDFQSTSSFICIEQPQRHLKTPSILLNPLPVELLTASSVSKDTNKTLSMIFSLLLVLVLIESSSPKENTKNYHFKQTLMVL